MAPIGGTCKNTLLSWNVIALVIDLFALCWWEDCINIWSLVGSRATLVDSYSRKEWP